MSDLTFGLLLFGIGCPYFLCVMGFADGYDDGSKSLKSLAVGLFWPFLAAVLLGQKWRRFEDAEKAQNN